MKLINDWSKAFRSLAVWLPIIATAIIAVLDILVQSNIVPIAYVPFIVAVSGFIGRIIKQPKF